MHAVSLLEQSLSSEYAFPGGGCTDTVIAHMASIKVMVYMPIYNTQCVGDGVYVPIYNTQCVGDGVPIYIQYD